MNHRWDKMSEWPQRFTGQNLHSIKTSNDKQRQFHESMKACGKFSELEISVLRFDSITAFKSFWQSTTDSRQCFDVEHSKGTKRLASKLQHYADIAYDVLHTMWPMLEIVKDFGAPFGGLAVGTISFFLIMAKNKMTMQNQLSLTMAAIKDRLPGLTVYRHIYNDKHELDQMLQSKIVAAYTAFIGFCIEASEFYRESGVRRWFKALGPQTTLETMSSEVQSAFTDVRLVAEELLSKTVNDIKQLNIEQTKEIYDLRQQIKVQKGHDNNRLNAIQVMMGMENYSAQAEDELLEKYRCDLQSEFDLYWNRLQRMDGSFLEAFIEEPKIQSWLNSARSSMLLLVGYNEESFLYNSNCWISPLALHMLGRSKSADTLNPSAYYITGPHDPESFSRVLLSVMMQILRCNTQSLRDDAQHAELLTEIREYQRALSSGNEVLESLQRICIRVLNLQSHVDTIWIILDRVDRCQLKYRDYERNHLMKTMMGLVEKTNVKLRVLATVNGYDWQVESQLDDICELERSKPDQFVIKTARQRRLDDQSP